MNRLACLVLVCAVLIGLAFMGTAFSAPAPSPEGIWLGTIKTPAGDLRIVFHATKNPDGSLKATADSLDQGAAGLQVDSFTVADGMLRIEMKMVGGSFEGKLSADGKKAEGQWKQNGASLPLTLERVDKVPEPNRPQYPRKPYPYNDEEVSYENAAAGATFAATLTYPKSAGPFPAVVLITGSGPQDRDETVFGQKPFLVLADSLTRQGIAVLRADDRGVGGSTGDRSKATTEDYAGDALAGVAYLKTRKEIDPTRIGLIGHSEGADIAPIAATRSADVAFIVLLAPSGMDGAQIILAQQGLILKAEAAPDDVVAKQVADTAEYLDVARQIKDDAAAEKRIWEITAARLAGMTDEQRKAAGITDASAASEVEAIVKQMLNPWFRFFITYDPRPALSRVKVPVLALWGEKDLQVPPKQNLPPVEGALRLGGNQHYVVKELPGLNHFFQTAKTGSPSEYARIEETMSPVALKTVGDWIVEQTRAKAP
ncbi:MAG: alpha/beta hydrolase [Armatimonadota bacterium]